MSNPEEKPKIIVDEDWKAQVQAEKEAMEKEGGRDRVAEGTAAASSPAGETAGTSPGETLGDLPPPPPASFAQLVTIFATQASVSLQQAAASDGQEAAAHLNYAKHFIDLLSVVEEKSKGNLNAGESQMLEGVLHELRMAFVSVQK